MGKSNGGTRKSSSNSPKGLSNTSTIEAKIASIKADFVSGREEAIADIKAYRAQGKVGQMVNAEIDRAIEQAENALRLYESVNSVQEVNEVDDKVGTELKRIASRLDDMARTHQANANDATGRVKNTSERAASALYMAAHNVRNASNYAPNSILARLWELYRSQNKWL